MNLTTLILSGWIFVLGLLLTLILFIILSIIKSLIELNKIKMPYKKNK